MIAQRTQPTVKKIRVKPVVVNLNNYPGFSFHLREAPPSKLNRDVLHLLWYEEKTTGGTVQRTYQCHGLRGSSISRPSEIKIDQLNEMTLAELGSINFSRNKSYCVLEFMFFRFRAGGGRLSLNINQLNEAAQAVPQIERYFSSAVK